MNQSLTRIAGFLISSLGAMALAPSAHAVTLNASASLSDITFTFSDSSGSVNLGQSETMMYVHEGDDLNLINEDIWGVPPTQTFSATSGGSTYSLSMAPYTLRSDIHYDAPAQRPITSFGGILFEAVVPQGVTVTATAHYDFGAYSPNVQAGFQQHMGAFIGAYGYGSAPDGTSAYISVPDVDVVSNGTHDLGTITSVFTNPSPVANQFVYDVAFSNNLTGPVSPVPEPESWALAVLGLALTGAGLARRRNRGRSRD